MIDTNINNPSAIADNSRKRVLVVGAGGFLGSFIVEEALNRGFQVWAGVRASTSRKYLSNPNINFLVLDFENPESLAKSLSNALPDGTKWDYIVYNLGATKCLRFTDFSRINYQYLRDFTEAISSASMVPEKFLYISSLSALGAGDEKNYTPFKDTDLPGPNTRYGASKLKAEMWLTMSGLPYIIFRPTGLYGPRDHDYFLMFKSIRQGFDFSVGFRRQDLTFLYAADLAVAVFDALLKAPVKQTYNLAHPAVWTQAQFRRLVQKEIGKRFVLPFRLPLSVVKLACTVAEKWGAATGKPSTLNSDKYNILKQRNWTVDISKAMADFGFSPKVDLPEGVSRCAKWYSDNGWL